MQEIRELSDDELRRRLRQCSISWVSGSGSRRRYEKQLFLCTQEKSPPFPLKIRETNEYFFYDLELPQSWTPGKTILKDGSSKSSRKKIVRFKPTELFGRGPILPHCAERFGHHPKNSSLHAPQCSNAKFETVQVLGQHAWMNREFLISCRYSLD